MESGLFADGFLQAVGDSINWRRPMNPAEASLDEAEYAEKHQPGRDPASNRWREEIQRLLQSARFRCPAMDGRLFELPGDNQEDDPARRITETAQPPDPGLLAIVAVET